MTLFPLARQAVVALTMLGICAFPAVIAYAELPPQVYRQRQAAAPEVLVINVRSVTTKETQRADHTLVAHTVEAVVQHVARTSRGVKPGSVIKIFYTQRRYNQPVTGPSEVPTLGESEVRPAYLMWDKDAEAFAPAAGGFSFTKVQSQAAPVVPR